MSSRGFFAPGSRIIVAVSGGSDSMALLEILSDLAARARFKLAVAHFEHGIRPEAPCERALVERRCRSLGLPFMCAAGDIPAESKRRRLGLEESARLLRYRFLEQCADSWKATAVALGHTRDDQVETILHNLLRGAGWRGLMGMPERRSVFIRPLLGCSRTDLRAFLRRRRIRWAADRSNRDTSIMRNRIRHILIPLLRNRFNPSIDESLLRLARNLAGSREALENPIRALLPRPNARGEIRVPLPKIRKLGDFGLYLLIDLVLRERFGVISDVESTHYDAVKRLVRCGRSGRLQRLPHDIEALVEQGYLRFRRVGNVPPLPTVVIPGPGRYLAPGWNLTVLVERERPRSAMLRATPRQAAFAALRFPIRIRERRPGDRIVPFGMTGRKKLSDLMIDRKIPLSQRVFVPVFEDENGPFWVPGVAADERTRAVPGRGWVFRIKLTALGNYFRS